VRLNGRQAGDSLLSNNSKIPHNYNICIKMGSSNSIMSNKKSIVVDAGNTRVKMAMFGHDALLHQHMITYEYFWETFYSWMGSDQIEQVLISDVSGKLAASTPANLPFNIHWLTDETTLPFKNLYETKATLGADRKALVAAAMHFYPKKPCLIIDAGTCVTFDLLTASEEYLGGSISPGLLMRLQAMHTFTGQLPLPTFNEIPALTGTSTDTCLLSGAYYGLIAEVDYLATHYQQQFAGLHILLTGGDAQVLAKRIKTSIFVHEHLLLFGLHKILSHHAK
jgi:type III pantothenate kinase